MRREIVSFRVAVAFAMAFALVALGVFVRDHYYSLYDDTFIYLRYVKHVRAGCGLRFNCDEAPVEGFTSPLYLAVLVAASVVTSKIVAATQVIGAISVAAVLLAAIALAARDGGEGLSRATRAAAALGTAALLAGDHYVLLDAVTGLETAMAAATGLALYAAVLADRRRTTVALTVVMFLLRPEGLVCVLALPVLRWARDRRVLAAAFGAVAAITLVRLAVFGDVLPNTAWAKTGGTARHVALGVSYALEALRDFPVLALAPLALVSARVRPANAYLLGVAATWTVIVVEAGGDCFAYDRLFFPLVPALVVAGARGLAVVVERATSARGLPAAVAATVVGLVLGAGGARAWTSHQLASEHGFPNVVSWTKVGRKLKTEYPGTRIATVPIGAIGFYSDLPLLDLVGLTSREIAHARRSVPPSLLTRAWIGHERNDLEAAVAWAPDLVVFTTTKRTPWTSLDDASAGFYADWLFLRAAKEGAAPYEVADLAIDAETHVLMLRRTPPR